MRHKHKHLSQWSLYLIAIGTSVMVSAAWILVAAYVTKDPQSGGNGGALAVIVSLWIVFLRRNYGERVFRAIMDESPALVAALEKFGQDGTISPFSNDELTTLLLAIASRMNVEADEQREQNLAVFFAGMVGTLAWAFGEYISHLLLK